MPSVGSDLFGGNAGHALGLFRGVVPHRVADRLESLGVSFDEGRIDEPFFHDDMGHCVEQPDVGARTQLKVHLGDARHPDRPWVGDDQARSVAHRPFHLHGDDRVRLGCVGADYEHQLGVADLGDRVGHRPRPEHGHQPGDRWSVSRGGTLVDVVGPERGAGQLLHQVVLFPGAAAGRNEPERIGAVPLLDVQ